VLQPLPEPVLQEVFYWPKYKNDQGEGAPIRPFPLHF